MSKFMYKPVLVEAFKLPERGDFNTDPFIEWAEKVGLDYESGRDETLIIETVHSVSVEAQPGDWIVKRAEGDFYPSSPESFENTFIPYTK